MSQFLKCDIEQESNNKIIIIVYERNFPNNKPNKYTSLQTILFVTLKIEIGAQRGHVRDNH